MFANGLQIKQVTMKEKIKIADIVNAFELGLIDRKQAETKLFDLCVVSQRSKLLSCDGECDWQLKGIQSNDYLECSKCGKRKAT